MGGAQTQRISKSDRESHGPRDDKQLLLGLHRNDCLFNRSSSPLPVFVSSIAQVHLSGVFIVADEGRFIFAWFQGLGFGRGVQASLHEGTKNLEMTPPNCPLRLTEWLTAGIM